MAKKYSRSEITPDLLKLNLQYFFEKPARNYKRIVDEIMLKHPVGFERWIYLMDHWHNFVTNPPVVDDNLRTFVDSVAASATKENMSQVLDIFDNMTKFMTTVLGRADDDRLNTISKEIRQLNEAIYDTAAERAREAEMKRLAEEREAEEKAEAEMREKQSAEQQVLEDLQGQIADLNKLFEAITNNKVEDSDTPKELVEEFANMAEAKQRLNEAKENANKIADLMENEIRIQRETEEMRKHEELIKRSDEKDEFDHAWLKYVDKYTSNDDKPDAALFEKFLIDVKGLTPSQVNKIEVAAEMFDDGIANFIEFDAELQRVKKLGDSTDK